VGAIFAAGCILLSISVATFAGSLTVEPTQTLTLKPPALQHVSVSGTANPPSARPGERVALWVDVTPKMNIRVYARGTRDVMPIALVMTPHPNVRYAKPSYPPGKLAGTIGLAEPAPVYSTTFRIVQPIVLGRSLEAGDTLTLGGAVNYQACDDHLCYPAASMPVMWSVRVR
jgi:hypothetical protein